MAKQTERVNITEDLHIYKQSDSKRWANAINNGD